MAPSPGTGCQAPTSSARRFWVLSSRILRLANSGAPRLRFMREMSRLVLESSDCDGLETRLWGPEVSFRWQAWRDGRNEFEKYPCPCSREDACLFPRHPVLERICRYVVGREPPPGLPCFTEQGSFWTADARAPVQLDSGGKPVLLGVAGETRSLCLLGFEVDEANAGMLVLESARPGVIGCYEIEHYEGVARMLGLAVADRRAQAALRERVKELTCVYEIARLVEDCEQDQDGLLAGVAEQVRRAFQYPGQAVVRISIDHSEARTAAWRAGGPELAETVEVDGEARGRITVSYPDPEPSIESDPFLPEETNLLAAVARELGLHFGRAEAARDRERLQQQLRHSDRLATIGQLSAGIAHELNEPLANILGFAQLVARIPDLPDQARSDVSRIEVAALHAREVIRKLMMFARQAPPRVGPVDLNELVRDGLLFLEGRCAKGGVELVRELAPGLVEIEADPSQLLQVLINLVVNAVQAMTHGGRLTVRTRQEDGTVVLEVADTGTGMSQETLKQVFLPFFTTKDVQEGTGLGLAVVDSIVEGHGGTIGVESKIGVGTTFTVRLPRNRPTREETSDV
ncbi:PAS domain-containing sensor histidine kinase [candidate division WOR-3 bacterium]|nr:PAS domain-containing sensor histidine kinase [candidate division WOR-3 bacterium]